MKQVTYGPGGFDPDKPNNNVISSDEVVNAEPSLPATLDPATAITLASALAVEAGVSQERVDEIVSEVIG